MNPPNSVTPCIHNFKTDSGNRVPTIDLLSKEQFKNRVTSILPSLQKEGEQYAHHKSTIGNWVVEWIGNDPHLHHFFSLNWKTANPNLPANVRIYSFSNITDEKMIKTLRGMEAGQSEGQQLTQVPDNLTDPYLMYCPSEKTFLSLNFNHYQHLQLFGALAPLEAFLLEKGRLSKKETLSNPEEVWLSLQGSCVEVNNEPSRPRGVLFLGESHAGKKTHAFKLLDSHAENKFHSANAVFLNCASLQVLSSENQTYLPVSLAASIPKLSATFIQSQLEDMTFSKEVENLLQEYNEPSELVEATQKANGNAKVRQAISQAWSQDPDAFAMIDLSSFLGEDQLTQKTTIETILFLHRNYMDKNLIRSLTPEEILAFWTQENNVTQYDSQQKDPDGYGVSLRKITKPYLNSFLIPSERNGDISLLRAAAYSHLAQSKKSQKISLNSRLPIAQTQFVLRKFLVGDIDQATLVKGFEVEEDILQSLELVKKEKEPIPERRMLDLVGIYTLEGIEVELVALSLDNIVREWIAFDKIGDGVEQIKAYSNGDLKAFYRKNKHVGAKVLFK